ncbi:hypothetical protein COY95_04710 [Candidatus Woesearchaeota archaeon CG_4_10_14_0_8_um_filter_47_5]|nr:MAG: hypothetical protein COY95_04710 [Candidatus Woesearchaeota archaeon CG_4_10_14_0_8_um_filter_47_5]
MDDLKIYAEAKTAEAICLEAGNTWIASTGTCALSDVEYPLQRYVFVTSGARNGNLGGALGGGFVDADKWCADEAFDFLNTYAGGAFPGDNPCPPGVAVDECAHTFKAWLSTSTVNAKERFTGDTPLTVDKVVPIYLVDGTTKVADDWDDHLDGNLDHEINVDSSGNLVSASYVWTNTKDNGEAAHAGAHPTQTCNDFTSTSYHSKVGKTSEATHKWTNKESKDCSNSYHLYCFQYFGCGDGIVDVDAGELCDDGNFVDGDGCSSSCSIEVI